MGMTPVYFGSPERPLFGAFHRPAGRWSGTRVVLCAPLGYEGPFAHLALRELAYSLTNAGAAVLRFDYYGYGDSAGSDEHLGQVTSWLSSVHDAIDEIKRLTPSTGPLVLVGLRAGALLASAVASTREDVTALALWAPSLSGKLFLREQRAFSSMAHVTTARRGMAEGQWGTRGFEANGYVFTDDTIAELTKLDVKSMDLPGVTDILLLDREEAPVRDAFPDAWRRPGVAVQTESIPGYAEFMEPPWLAVSPDSAIQKIASWAQRLTHQSVPPVPVEAKRGLSSAVVQPNVTETPIWLDDHGQHFGILTEPANGPASHAIILITSTFGYRIGPNRMNVAAARRFAAMGIATLRFDLSDTGDSRAQDFARAKIPYDLSAIEDVKRASRFLTRRGYHGIALGGVCAGAFMAWYTGLMTDEISQLVLVNPETFRPIRYELRDHQKMLQGMSGWREVLRRERNPLRLARAAVARVRTVSKIGWEHVAARLPFALVPSSLAARINTVGTRGTKLSIIYSSDDLGIEEFHRQLGPNLRRHEQRGYLRMSYIEGADHSFTPRWATQALIDRMAQELTPWLQTPSTYTGVRTPAAPMQD
jgi:dienelactone hydrolase